MLTIMRFVALVLALAAGIISSTLFSSSVQKAVEGFSQEEAQAKLGRRVKLKANAIEPKIVNTGVVAYTTVVHGERVLVIDWDEKLPGWKHRITQIDRQNYQRAIVEEQ